MWSGLCSDDTVHVDDAVLDKSMEETQDKRIYTGEPRTRNTRHMKDIEGF